MLVVVGGNSRNIGKTSVMASLIRAMPEANWTAVKITQYGHNVCSTDAEPCDCAAGDLHPFSLSEEMHPNETDSGRYLAAGAVRSYWLRTAEGNLGAGMEPLRGILNASENAIFESNSVIQFLRPHLYIVVLDFSVDDVKKSLQRWIDRADALAIVERGTGQTALPGLPNRLIASKPRFPVSPPNYYNSELVEFVRQRLVQAVGSTTARENR